MGNMIVDELGRIPMSPYLTATLARAADYATAQAHRDVAVEHLLLALTEDPEASVVLKASQVDVARLSNDVAGFIGQIEDRQADGGAATISIELRRILEAAAAAAQQGRRREINGAIVLAAIVGDGKSTAAQLLREQGLTFEEAIRALQRVAQAQSPKPAPAPVPPQTSADDLMASARARVQTRAPREPAPIPIEAVEEAVDPAADELFEEELPTPTLQAETRRYGIGPAERDGLPPAVSSDVRGGMGPLTTEPERVAPPVPPMPQQIPGPFPSHVAEAPPPEPPRPAPSAPPARGRQSGWAPAAPRNAPGPGPGAGARPGLPPPLPSSPGPLQIPGQIPPQYQASGAPRSGPGPGPGVPGPGVPGPGGPGFGPRPPSVPWQDANEPAAGPAQPSLGGPPGAAPSMGPPPSLAPPPGGAPQQRARQAARGTVSAGQLVHNFPPRMTIGVSLMCEARIGKAEVKAIVEGLQGGGAVVRHEVMVTKAMSVRLRSPDGAFFIESSSPETQWIENVLGMPAEDFARWRWTLTPREKGRKRLQLIVSARTVGADGLAAETAMPDQVVEIKVRTNYGRSFKRLLVWSFAALLGGVLGRFGDVALGAVRSILGW